MTLRGIPLTAQCRPAQTGRSGAMPGPLPGTRKNKELTLHVCHTPRKLSRNALLAIIAILILAGTGTAEPPTTGRRSSPDLGTWKWSVNKTLVMTLRLKHEGDRLTGILIGNDGPEKEIQDGKYDDGKISFRVTSVVGKGEVTAEYAGVLAGTVINGGTRVYFGARPRTLPGYMPWQAKRVRE
jgi:hypothetical protein